MSALEEGTLHKVQYYETDQMGVVHHSNYIRWFEEARAEWMEAVGLPYAQLEAEGIASPVLSVACAYRRPVRYGEIARIRVRLTAYNGVKLSVAYRVEDAATGQERIDPRVPGQQDRHAPAAAARLPGAGRNPPSADQARPGNRGERRIKKEGLATGEVHL